MQLAILQTNPVFGDVKNNIREAVAYIGSISADLYLLPELFNTGYNFIDEKELGELAEPVQGRTYDEMFTIAKAKSCFICYGFAEKAERVYNAAALVGPEGLIGLYRKVHLYYREKLFFAPGNLGFPVFELPFGTVGMMICFDWIFPESARSLALAGAELLLHPANLVLPHCPDAMVTRCLENKVFTATANRIGTEDRGGISLSYIGKSEIVSPRGEILTRLGDRQAGITSEEIDLSLARSKKINEYNNLMTDRRTEQYRLE
jgi:predicted amidohydrolase